MDDTTPEPVWREYPGLTRTHVITPPGSAKRIWRYRQSPGGVDADASAALPRRVRVTRAESSGSLGKAYTLDILIEVGHVHREGPDDGITGSGVLVGKANLSAT